MLTTTRRHGEFIPSSRVSPLTAVDLLVQFLDHRHRSSAHSILVPVPILLDVPILRSSLAPRPHTSSSRSSRSAPSTCRRRHRLPPCQCSLLPPLPPPPAAPFLCLISLSSSSSLYSSSQSEGAVLGVTLWPLVLLSAPTTAFPLPLPPLASPTTALPSDCAHHGGAHTTPHHGAHDSALARETTPWWALPRWGARHAHDSARHAVVLFSDEYRWSGICFGAGRGWGGLSSPPPLADRACERHAEHHRKRH
jgi:hypothetical protein